MKISNSCQSQKGGQFHLFNRRNSYGYNFTSFDMDFSIIVPQFYTLLMSKLYPQNSGGPHSEEDCFYKAVATVPPFCIELSAL